MKWEKISRTVSEEGTTIVYRGQDPLVTVESRKRRVPHAFGSSKSGTYDVTTFHVCVGGVPVHESTRLTDAIAYAEQMMGAV